MAPFLPIRAISRSQAVRIGKQTVKTGTTTYVDLASQVETGGIKAGSPLPFSPFKELQNHLAIGAIITVGGLTFTNSDWAVDRGIVTVGAEETSGEFSVTTIAGAIRQRSTGKELEETELKATKKLSATAGNERIDIVTVSTNAGGAAKYTAGTAAAAGKAVVPKTTAELETAKELLVAEVVFTASKTVIVVRNVNHA